MIPLFKDETSNIIGFEGIDCTGKSTLVQNLAHRFNIPYFHEPTQPIHKKVQDLPLCFALDRLKQFSMKILPLQGRLVLLDRTEISGWAYQTEMGISEKELKKYSGIYKLKEVFLLTIDRNTLLKRLQTRNQQPDRYESVEFLLNVQNRYLKMAREQKFKILDGRLPTKTLIEQVETHLFNQFNMKPAQSL